MVAPNRDTIRVGQRGTITIPQRFREMLGLEEGSFLVAEIRDGSMHLMPAMIAPEIELYTPERIAEFLLNNAIGREEYERAREEARKLGLDPDSLAHTFPPPKD
jgi:AbrB family looped-hinge helix DNA binding protein